MEIVLSATESQRWSGMLGLLVLSEVLFEMADKLDLTRLVVTFSDGGRVLFRGDQS